ILGRAAESRETRVDLPAFGKPTTPTSASSFSSRWIQRSSPARPRSARRGARLVDVAKRALPRPPLAPRATTRRWPRSTRSPRGAPPSRSETVVPRGTRRTVSAPLRGVVPLVVEIEERGDGRIGLEDHVPAVPPIAAVGTTAGHELLTSEADAARAAVASLDEHVDLVDEHGVVGPARGGRGGSGRLLLGDADVLVVPLALEAHVAVGLGEERVVDAQAHVGARLEAGPALADQDAAGGDELAAEALHPQHLGIRVAAVAGAADALLVRHRLDLDLGDADRRHRLAMPAVPPVVLPPLELHDQDLVALALRHHLARHLGGGQRLGLEGHLPVVVDQEDLRELDRGTLVLAEALDLDDLTGTHPVLLAARRDDRFHARAVPFCRSPSPALRARRERLSDHRARAKVKLDGALAGHQAARM